MNIKYFGTSIPFNEIPQEINFRRPNFSGAAKKREMYLLDIFAGITSSSGLYFITPAYGKNGGFFKSLKLVVDNKKYIFLGYFGKGIIRIITSYIYAFLWVLKNIKTGDTVITYNFPPIYAIPLLLKKIFIQFRLIVGFEDFYNIDDKRHYLFGPFEKFGISYADAFIASSVGMSNYIKERRKCASIIINGGYFEDLMTNSKYEGHENLLNTTKIVYSGTLDKERGIRDLIELFQSNKSDKFNLTFSGSGPLEEYVKEMSEQDSRINFVGLLNDEDYSKLIVNSHVCVNPQWGSISVNFPSKITMYLSFGKIVLSTKIFSLVNSPYKDLLNFYDEDNAEEFWDKLLMIRSNFQQSNNDAHMRILKFKEIIEGQKEALIKLIDE